MRSLLHHPLWYGVVAAAGIALGYLFHTWIETPPPDRVPLAVGAVVHVERLVVVKTSFRSCEDVAVAATDNLDATLNSRTCTLRLTGDYAGTAALRVILFDARGYARHIGIWSGRVE